MNRDMADDVISERGHPPGPEKWTHVDKATFDAVVEGVPGEKITVHVRAEAIRNPNVFRVTHLRRDSLNLLPGFRVDPERHPGQ